MPGKSRRRRRAQEETIQQSCPLCDMTDDDEMVSCDNCHRWFHYPCVGVDHEVAHRDWSCQECDHAIIPASQTPPSTTPALENTGEPQNQSSLSQSQVPRSPTHGTPILPVPSPRILTPHSHMPESPVPSPRSPRSLNRPPLIPLDQRHLESVDLPTDPDLVTKLPQELRIQFLKEQEELEYKFLLRRYQLLLGSHNESATELRPPLINNDVGVPAMCHSSPVGQSRYIRPQPPQIPPISPEYGNCSHNPVHSKEVRDRPSMLPFPPPRTNQHSNIPCYQTAPANQYPSNSTYVPPQTAYPSNAPVYSHLDGNQRQHTSAFVPIVSHQRTVAPDYFPSYTQNDPTGV